MKILYDLSSAQPQGLVLVNGGGEYSLSVLTELLKYIRENKLNIQIDVLLNKHKGDNKKIFEVLESFSINYHKYDKNNDISNLSNDYNMLFLPIMYPDYCSLSVNDKTIVVGLIHDLSSYFNYYLTNNYGEFIKLDSLNFLRHLKKRLIQKKRMAEEKEKHEKLFRLNNNTYVFTVSNYTASAIKYFLDDCEVKNVYYTIMKKTIINEYNDETILDSFGIEKNNYFLLSSCSRWAKNALRTVEALDELFTKFSSDTKFSSKKVVLLGCDDRTKKYYKKIVKNIDKFVFHGFVDDANMECLYKNAFLFIYPSILEGYGLPPIEAMELGTLSACSTSTSIPEICGNAVIYFDPYNKDSIKTTIISSFDSKIREQKKKDIVNHLNYLKNKQEKDCLALINNVLELLKHYNS